MREYTRIPPIDPVVWVRWCREQGDSWEDIATSGAIIHGETGELLSPEQVRDWFEAQNGGQDGGHGQTNA